MSQYAATEKSKDSSRVVLTLSSPLFMNLELGKEYTSCLTMKSDKSTKLKLLVNMNEDVVKTMQKVTFPSGLSMSSPNLWQYYKDQSGGADISTINVWSRTYKNYFVRRDGRTVLFDPKKWTLNNPQVFKMTVIVKELWYHTNTKHVTPIFNLVHCYHKLNIEGIPKWSSYIKDLTDNNYTDLSWYCNTKNTKGSIWTAYLNKGGKPLELISPIFSTKKGYWSGLSKVDDRMVLSIADANKIRISDRYRNKKFLQMCRNLDTLLDKYKLTDNITIHKLLGLDISKKSFGLDTKFCKTPRTHEDDFDSDDSDAKDTTKQTQRPDTANLKLTNLTQIYQEIKPKMYQLFKHQMKNGMTQELYDSLQGKDMFAVFTPKLSISKNNLYSKGTRRMWCGFSVKKLYITKTGRPPAWYAEPNELGLPELDFDKMDVKKLEIEI